MFTASGVARSAYPAEVVLSFVTVNRDASSGFRIRSKHRGVDDPIPAPPKRRPERASQSNGASVRGSLAKLPSGRRRATRITRDCSTSEHVVRRSHEPMRVVPLASSGPKSWETVPPKDLRYKEMYGPTCPF